MADYCTQNICENCSTVVSPSVGVAAADYEQLLLQFFVSQCINPWTHWLVNSGGGGAARLEYDRAMTTNYLLSVWPFWFSLYLFSEIAIAIQSLEQVQNKPVCHGHFGRVLYVHVHWGWGLSLICICAEWFQVKIFLNSKLNFKFNLYSGKEYQLQWFSY